MFEAFQEYLLVSFYNRMIREALRLIHGGVVPSVLYHNEGAYEGPRASIFICLDEEDELFVQVVSYSGKALLKVYEHWCQHDNVYFKGHPIDSSTDWPNTFLLHIYATRT